MTPFHGDGSLNLPLFGEHASSLLQNGVNGVTLFGTTGEGASIGFNERSEGIATMIERGISPDQISVGLCACAIADAVSQVAQAAAFGVTRFLLLPPFYFKELGDAGLYEWHSELFGAADARARFILYHIPQVTQVPLSFDLVMRLRKAFPDRVMAIKDSAGNWDNTRKFLENGDVPVLVGDERLLHKAAAIGAAGSICGMANLYPRRMRTLFDTCVEDPALSADVGLVVSGPVIPSLKQVMVAVTGNESWGNLRPPFEALSGQAHAAIAARFPSGNAA